MKNIIILLLISSNCFAQDSLVLNTIGLEKFVVNYKIQQSKDTISGTWTDIETIIPEHKKDSNSYSVSLPTPNLFYRAVAIMVSNQYTTSSLLLTGGILPVTVTSFVIIGGSNYVQVQWKSENESGLKSYSLYRSLDGRNFTYLQSFPLSNGSYNVNILRPITTVIKGWWIFKRIKIVTDMSKEYFSLYTNNIDGTLTLITTSHE